MKDDNEVIKDAKALCNFQSGSNDSESKIITPNDLIKILEGYDNGKKQDKVLAIWCEMPKYLEEISSPFIPDAFGFAQKLGTVKGILFINILTGLSKSPQEVEERILQDKSNKIELIVSAPLLYQLNNGVVEFAEELKQKTEIPIILLIHPDYRGKIKADLSKFDQLTCVDEDSSALKK